MQLTLNGVVRDLADVEERAGLDRVIAALDLKADRVAVEWNGEVLPRSRWATTEIASGDRLEVVHFVGGG